LQITYKNSHLEQLARQTGVKSRLPHSVVLAYRDLVREIESAEDERELRQLKGHHFEKMSGEFAGQYSIRLNRQFRMVFEIRTGSPKNTIHVVYVGDYH